MHPSFTIPLHKSNIHCVPISPVACIISATSPDNPRVFMPFHLLQYCRHFRNPDAVTAMLKKMKRHKSPLITYQIEYQSTRGFDAARVVISVVLWLLWHKRNYTESQKRSPPFYFIFIYGFNGSRTLLHVLLSKLLNSVTPLPSFGLYTG